MKRIMFRVHIKVFACEHVLHPLLSSRSLEWRTFPLLLLLLFQPWCCHDLEQILKWGKAQCNRRRHKLFEYMKESKWHTHKARLEAVWVRGSAWATADELVNEQTWRPPLQHRSIPSFIPTTPLPPSPLQPLPLTLLSCWFLLYCRPLTSRLIETLHLQHRGSSSLRWRHTRTYTQTACQSET